MKNIGSNIFSSFRYFITIYHNDSFLHHLSLSEYKGNPFLYCHNHRNYYVHGNMNRFHCGERVSPCVLPHQRSGRTLHNKWRVSLHETFCNRPLIRFSGISAEGKIASPHVLEAGWMMQTVLFYRTRFQKADFITLRKSF